MSSPLNSLYRVRRIAWLTAVGVMVWPVSLAMAWAYPGERKYWLGVFAVSMVLTAVVVMCLVMRGIFDGHS